MASGAALRRTLEALWVLALAALIVVPALPGSWQTELTKDVIGWTKKVSLSQHWSMYAPNPQRGIAYLNIRGRHLDGHEEPLEEAGRAEAGWGTVWGWEKRRRDIWAFYAGVSKKKGGNLRRTWFVKSICIREARRSDHPPRLLLVDRVSRTFTHPDKVRAGEPDLSPLVRTPVQKIDCGYPPIQRMIEEDRRRHGPRG